LAAIEENFPALVSSNEMAPTFEISNPTPPMRMQRNDISRCNASVNDAHPLIFEQQSMVSRRGDERIE
jgi:hypothetical protein